MTNGSTCRATRALLGVLLAGTMLAGVAHHDDVGDAVPKVRRVDLLLQGVEPTVYFSGLPTPQRLLIDDVATWARTWQAITGTLSPTPPLPPVDFARHVVVIAASGTRSNSGYTISIDHALAVGDDIFISVTEESPGNLCGVLPVMTSPMVVVVIPRPSGNVTFDEHHEHFDCD